MSHNAQKHIKIFYQTFRTMNPFINSETNKKANFAIYKIVDIAAVEFYNHISVIANVYLWKESNNLRKLTGFQYLK